MKLLSITKDSDGVHKYVAKFLLDNGRTKTTHFGAVGYEDFTIHKDEERKKLYLERHEKNENWNNPTTAGSLSRFILWNKKTLKASINDYKKRFNL
jgi:hypothetical protein